jgi:hypothetical protein
MSVSWNHCISAQVHLRYSTDSSQQNDSRKDLGLVLSKQNLVGSQCVAIPAMQWILTSCLIIPCQTATISTGTSWAFSTLQFLSAQPRLRGSKKSTLSM